MNDKVNELRAEADRLEALRRLYPDLREYRGRWRKVLVSKKAAADCGEAELRRTCGCCSDAPYRAWPYVDTDFGRVYCDPPEHHAVNCDWSTATADEDLAQRLREAGVREEVAEDIAYKAVVLARVVSHSHEDEDE
jgi:hypothetical protein